MQVDVGENERHLELIRDVLLTKQRAFEALWNKLIEIFPELETTESDSVDANQIFSAFIKLTEEPDKTVPMWELLQKISPGIESIEAKVEQAQKAMETFVADCEKHNERLHDHWLERQKRRSEIEARLSALEPFS